MREPMVFVFDSSPLVAGCQFSIGNNSAAKIAVAGSDVRIPPAVYREVVLRGGSRPDAMEAARLINDGHLTVVDATEAGDDLQDLQHYQLGEGERMALSLTARLGKNAVLVTDDFLALVVGNRLNLSCRLFLDFIVARAISGELNKADARQIINAISLRYPAGFVPHSLAMLERDN